MKIKVLSREKAEIEVFNIKEPTLIISIRDFKDPDKARVSIKNENIKGIVFLNFDDVEENDRYYSCITDEDAKKICEAVNEMKDFVTQIIIHCEAGVSRSAGVAAAIGKYLNGDDMFIFGAPRFSPNITCYRKVLNTFMNENVPLDLDKIKFSNEVFSKALIYSRTEEEYKELFFNNEEELNKWVLDRSSI